MFWLPKKGATAEEYEDAFAFSETHTPGAPFRAAVADGATEAVFAGRWARLLTERFASGGAAIFSEDLPAAQDAWAAAVDGRGETLPWYAAEKAASGAFATLLGLTLHLPRPHGEAGSWRAVGVGDSNVFHLREGDVLRAWPLSEAGNFGTRPALVPSRSSSAAPAPRSVGGSFRAGDAFVLTTDAAAAWLLRTDPADALRWPTSEAFAEAVLRARASGLLKNDDTTVAVVRVAPDA